MSPLHDWKRLVGIILAGGIGWIVLLDITGIAPQISPIATLFVNWAAVLTGLALLIGVASVATAHVRRVRKREQDWLYSVLLLFMMLVVIFAGIVGVPGSDVFFPSRLEQPVLYLFRTVYEPLAGSMLGLLAFFSLSAALRALREPRPESVVIIVVALLVLLAQLPVLAGMPGVGGAVGWVQEYISLAGARGLILGAAIGTIVAATRVLVGFDYPYVDR